MLLTLRYPLAYLIANRERQAPLKFYARVNDSEYAHLRVGSTFDGAIVVKIVKEQTTK